MSEDKQEALAGEGVEPCERCDDSGYAEASSGGIWTGENVRTTQTICDCPCGEDVRRERAEALAGDDRNGVEGYRAKPAASPGFSGWWEVVRGHATVAMVPPFGARDTRLLAERIVAALSLTPSSPQADEADVERVALDAVRRTMATFGDAGNYAEQAQAGNWPIWRAAREAARAALAPPPQAQETRS